MQAVTVIMWVLVVGIALPMASVPLPSLGTAMLCILGGLATILVFVIFGGDAWAWISGGLGCLAVVLAAVGARTLVFDAPGTLQWPRQTLKEMAAGFAGLGLPFFAIAAFLSFVVAAAS